MGCSREVTLYDADAVDALGGVCGRNVETLDPATDKKLAGFITKRLYLEACPCSCGHNECDVSSYGIEWPRHVDDKTRKSTVVCGADFY